MADKLLSAFKDKAKAEQYLSNLEKLKQEGSVESIQYDTLKAEYSRMRQDAQLTIDDEKSQFQKILEIKKQELASLKLDLKYLEIRHKVGEISLDVFNKKKADPYRKITDLEATIAQLEEVINADSTSLPDMNQQAQPVTSTQTQQAIPSPTQPVMRPSMQPKKKKSFGFSFSFGKKKQKIPVTPTPPIYEKPAIPAAPPREIINLPPPVTQEPPQIVEEAPKKIEEIPLPPGLEITNLDILPTRVAAGNHVGILATAKNNTPNPIQHRIELRINDEVKDYREIFLLPGKSEEITFMVLTNYDGEYKVSIGGQIGRYTVLFSR
jgi:hypothetical protein